MKAVDIQTRKLHLIEDITKLSDPTVIAKVEELLRDSKTEGGSNSSPKPYDLSQIKGLLTAEEAEKYHRHTEETRKEWDNAI